MSTTKNLNRGLALALILALVLCLLPVAAHAYSGGSGTQAAPYLIANATDLNSLRTAVNGGNAQSGVYFKLTADITTAQTGVIGNASGKVFSGNFDGDGHNIALNISSSNGYQGLFGRLNGATVENLSVSGSVTSTNGSRVGGIAGYATNSTIENCSNSASVTAKGHAAGIVGYSEGTGTISACFNTGTIYSSDTKAGGIVAEQYTNVTVANCYNLGNVTGTSTAVGGIVGYSRGAVSNCYHAVGTITGPSTKGAIIGHMYSSGSVTNCYYVATSQGLTGVGNTTGGTELTVAQMKAAAASLGNYYEADSNNVNSGYPILYWQGSGSTPSTGIVDALNDLMGNYGSDIMIYDEPAGSTYDDGDTIYDASVYLDSPEISLVGTDLENVADEVYVVWTSSSSAVSVPSAGNGTATVTHSTSTELSVTLTAYLRTIVDNVTYTSTDYVRYNFTISRDLGEYVTRTVYVSIFNNKNAPNSPIVSGTISGVTRNIVAVPVTVSGYENTICVDDALRQLHVTYNKSNDYVTSNGMITKLWGETNTNNAFGIYRNDVLTNTVTSEHISDGDLITAFTYKNTSSYNDRYLCFNNTVYTITADDTDPISFAPSMSYKLYSGNTATSVSGSTFFVYKLNASTGALDSATGEVTINNGTVTVEPNVYGTYVLLAQHDRERLGLFSGYVYYVPGVALLKVGMNDATAIELDKAALTLTTGANNTVVSYVNLPASGVNGSTITWQDLSGTISPVGLVTRPNVDTLVTLTATISKGNATPETKNFYVTVPARVSDYSTLLPSLTTALTPDSEDVTSSNIEDYLWYILDVIAYENEAGITPPIISASEKADYYSYAVSYAQSVITGSDSNAQKSNDLCKTMMLLKALNYDNSGTNSGYSVNNIDSITYNGMTKKVQAWLEYFASAAINEEQPVTGYLHTLAFVLIADLEEPTLATSSFLTTARNLLVDQETVTENNVTRGWWTEIIDEDAMILTGLGAYKKYMDSNNTTDSDVEDTIENSVNYLSYKQLANGSFGLGSNAVIGNANSTAFVLIALAAADEDPTGSGFTKNGRTVVDGLLTYYNASTGMFQTEGIENDLATEQAYRALVTMEAYDDLSPKTNFVIYSF